MRNETILQVAIAVLQLAAITAIYLFLSRVYVPATGIIGVLVWLTGCFVFAGWLDGTRWKFSVAFTVLAVANFAVFLLALKFAGNWGFVWVVPFLWFGYRLAGVEDRRAKPQN